jgi:hypothetical protein
MALARILRRRRLLAAFVAFAGVAAPAALAQIGGGAGASSTTGTPGSPDTIQYVQTTGKSGTYVEYVPGNGSSPTTQSVTGSGGCATPTVSGPPILGFGARLNSASDYGGSWTAAVVGAYKSRTGVCAIPPDWSIENQEALDFSVGTNSLVAGRIFSDAQLQLEREDKTSSTSIEVELVEYQGGTGGTQVASETYAIDGPEGTQILADSNLDCSSDSTNSSGDCPATTGFDTVEVRVLTPGGSVSVVGPTSTFTLASEICGGQTITTSSTDGTAGTGEVTASISLPSTSGCKSYTQFSASIGQSGTRTVEFASPSTTGTAMTATIDWGDLPGCEPTPPPTGSSELPSCPVTEVAIPTVDGGAFEPQTFCAAPSTTSDPPGPVCTTSKTYSYVSVDGHTYTDVTETWAGLDDVAWRNG